ncbi:sialate O-acetylesterase [Paenibacillus sp. GCM10027626]|uniref:sialate O-acetylesterase n=1 Tax=Paenibacillus sp. GCM10027626 TaxID=3273411 RepID=UPI00363FFD13
MRQQIKWVSPTPHQVFQRNLHDQASIAFSVQVAGGIKNGRLEVRTSCTSWKACGLIEGHEECLTGTVENLTTGEHTLYVRIVDGEGAELLEKCSLGPIFVGDLWILAGQSNMEGCGRLIDVEAAQAGVSCFYLGDRWDIAAEPLHWALESHDPVHWKNWMPYRSRSELNEAIRRDRVLGSGLGMAFGKELLLHSGVPTGLVMAASGGTSMSEWDPELKHLEGGSLYGAMLRIVEAAGGQVKGCLWYQGESDATEEAAEKYAERMRRFVSCLRQDLGDASLPFIYVQLGPVYTQLGLELAWPEERAWNRIQNEQLLLEAELAHVALVPAIDMLLDDFIHLGSASLKELGRRVAATVLNKVYHLTAGSSGPRLSAAAWTNGSRTGLKLSFTGLNGGFQLVDRPFGFSLMSEGVAIAHKAKLTEDRRGILLCLAIAAPEGCTLWHGKGLNPTVNLKDQSGYPLPVWGPIPV